VDTCTGCLRSNGLSDHQGRLWCNWCSDFADRYVRRMPGSLNVECVLCICDLPTYLFCTPAGGDLAPGQTWTWPTATVELWNRSQDVLVILYPETPLTCLELIIRDEGGDSFCDHPSHGTEILRSPGVDLRTEIPPGRRLEVQFDPLARSPSARRRSGQYTITAVYRNADWQAVSEPASLYVRRMPHIMLWE
jgi:hypothetical protein